MKIYIVQSLALIGTVLFIMEAASKPPPEPNKTELLKIILRDATNLSKNLSKHLLEQKVADPTLGEVECWACFFWGAETSLTNKGMNNSALTRHLHEYNKLGNNTNCTLNSKRCHLQRLLEHIITCANITV